MSGSGGDQGGGGGDSGGGGKGGGGDSGSGKGGGGGVDNSAPIVYGYNDPSAAPSANASYSPSSAFADPSDPSGGNSGLPSLIANGNSPSSGLDDLIGAGNGLNLAGSGPVGSMSPAISGGMFFGAGDNAPAFVPSSGDDSGFSAPSGGGGSSAAAFAAPEGISGTPQLSDLVKQPDGSDAGGGIGSDIAASGPGQGVNDMLSGLGAAEKSVTDQWAANNATSVPSIGSDAGAPVSMGGGGGGGSGGGGSGGSGSNPMGNAFSSNPLGVGAAGVGLLNNLVSGNKSPAYSPELNAAASSAGATGQQQTAAGQALQQYVSTGKLPQGYEDQVQQAAQAAKQTIISNYANRGLPTDPTKNSTLAQELAQVDARLPAMREQIAGTLAQTGSGMISTGLQATGIQSGVYQTLANLQNSQNQQRAQAIANFAASLNGGVKSKAA